MAATRKQRQAELKISDELVQAKTSPWSGLRSRFLESLSAEEQVRIFDLSARAAQTLHRWAARYPLIRRVRVWPLALSVAAAAPFATVDALISTARLSLWVFTLDDIFDEERVPHVELFRRAERYRAIATGLSTDTAGDSLAAALCEVRDDLMRFPLFAPLAEEWTRALCGTIDAMTQEYSWRQTYRREADATLPSYTDYLATALYSIGGPPHVWAALITTNDPSTPQHLERLRSMEQLASTCIRLANDLQSYPKEVSEEKINALVLLSRSFEEAGLAKEEAYQEAKQRVQAGIEDGLAHLTELQRTAVTRSGRPEAAIANIARFVCDFYVHHDYHTFAPQTG